MSDRFLTTVLMTDIVGSTEHAAVIGDSAWRELVGEHNRMVRAALRRHGGREVDTAGDGFFAVFDAPAAAISCAIEAAAEVQRLGIDIRAGVHVGEVEQMGRKVGGISVPIAARIMATAEGGDVFVSGTTRDLAAGSGLVFVDRGIRELKGVPGDWHIFAATRPGQVVDAGGAGDAASRRAAAVRRAQSRPVWQRRPRLVAAAVIGLALVVVGASLGVWKPWQLPALPAIGDDSIGMVDEGRSEITASIPVESQPGGVAIADGFVWITNTGADSVAQVNLATRQVTRLIDVGQAPLGLTVADGSVWVANSGGRTVTRINVATGRPVDSIAVGNGPIAVAAAGGSVWIANVNDSTVVAIDTSTGRPGTAVPVAAGPVALAADESGLWIASADAAAITHLAADGVTLAPPISLPSRPTAISSAGGAVWVASADGTVTRIDQQSQRVTATVDVGGRPTAIAVSPQAVWVADRQGALVRLDAANPSAPARRVSTGSSPEALAVDSGQVWVAARAAAATHRGGTLRIASIGLPGLDPLDSFLLTQFVSDGLVGYPRVGGAAGSRLIANLATALPKPTNGGRTYTFQLRPDIMYSSGQPVRPSDFRRAIERSFTVNVDFFGDAVGGDFFAGLSGAEACIREDRKAVPVCDLSTGIQADDNANVVTFQLGEPDPDFLLKLAASVALPLPDGVPLTSPIEGPFPGTGPYVVAEHDEQHVRLTRNPGFQVWDEDARPDGFPDQIVWTAAETAEEAAASVERGEADYVRLELEGRLPGEVFARISRDIPGQLHSAPNGVVSVTMNSAMAPFDSLAARQAVNMAIDRGHLVDLRGGPLAAALSCQILLPGWPGYQPYCPYTTHPDPGGRWQAPNLDAARRLIDESGTRGAKVAVGPVLDIFAGERDYLGTLLQDLGYDVSVDTNTDTDYVLKAHFEDNRVQLSVWEWFGGFSAGDFLRPFKCGEPDGTTNFCDPAYDTLVAEADEVQASDVAAAIEKWAAVDRKAVDLAIWAPLYSEGSDFVSARVGNYQFHSFYLALLDQMWVQ